jgi:nitrogenase molybdenum-iron protein alpha/beta subunit
MSRATEQRTTVEDFALKGLQLAKMTGVSAAAHAVSDSFLLQHAGVGCKYKAAAQQAQHDWGSHPNKREAWTQVGETSLIKGAAERIGPFARTWYDRRRPGVMIVVTAYFIELTGDDTADYVRQTEQTLPCPVITVPTAGPNGGFYDGYAGVMWELMQRMAWKDAPTRTRTAAVLGHFFHRYEMDQIADVEQLRALIKVAGLEVGPVLFAGESWAQAEQAPACDVAIELPYAYPVRRKIKRTLRKRTHVVADLPIGLAGTSRFLRQLVRETGGDPAPVEAYITAEVERTREFIAYVTNHRLRELNAWIFADTPLAAGLVTLLGEIGIPVAYVGLRDDSLGGKTVFYEMLDRNGVDPSGFEIDERPSLYRIQQAVVSRVVGQRGAIVIGSSHELSVFTRDIRLISAGTDAHVALLETGMPSNNYHAAFSAPTFGYQGVLAWTQRILDASLRSEVGGYGG